MSEERTVTMLVLTWDRKTQSWKEHARRQARIMNLTPKRVYINSLGAKTFNRQTGEEIPKPFHGSSIRRHLLVEELV